MKKNTLFFVAAILLSMTLVMVTGCDDDDGENIVAPTVTSKPFVSAVVGINRHKVESGGVFGYATVTNFSSIPSVTMNGEMLRVEPELSIYGGGMGFMGDFDFDEDMQVDIVIGFGPDSETGTGSVVLPGYFEVVGETNVDVVPGSGVTVSWTTAEQAELYVAAGYFSGRYTDSDGESHYWDKNFGFTTTDTTLVISADAIWPDMSDVENIEDMSGDLDVYAVSGPATPGDPVNVSGACEGVLVSYSNFLDWNFNEWNPESAGKNNDREMEINVPEMLLKMLNEQVR